MHAYAVLYITINIAQMKKKLHKEGIYRAGVYNSHNAEITLLNERLQREYGDKALTFRRDGI